MTWYIKLHLDWRGLISMNNQRYDFSEVFSFLKSKDFRFWTRKLVKETMKDLGNYALLECYKCFFIFYHALRRVLICWNYQPPHFFPLDEVADQNELGVAVTMFSGIPVLIIRDVSFFKL